MDKRRILLIAGSDSSGGAGLEGDQKVIAAHGCYAMTATTALTAQNTEAVSAIYRIPSGFIVRQVDACISDIGVDVVKIGMLASAETVDAVANALRRHGSPIIVLDPVMVSTSGAQLLPDDAVLNLRTQLLPITTILTPNIPEARLLLKDAGLETPEIRSLDDIVNIARTLQSLGPQYVLVKGGHLPLTKDGRISTQNADHHIVVDVLHDAHRARVYETDYQFSKNTHGTGCSLACERCLIPLLLVDVPPPSLPVSMLIFLATTLSSCTAFATFCVITLLLYHKNISLPRHQPTNLSLSTTSNPSPAAIASNIVLSTNPDLSITIPNAVANSCRYIEAGIRTSFSLGRGNGPINHFHSLETRMPPLESSLKEWLYEK